MATGKDWAGKFLDLGAGTRKALDQGTQRTVTPRVTLERVAPLLAQAGITRVANVTGLDRIGIPVVMVVRPNARSVAVSQGKGLSLEAAKASGIMEAIELHHAETAELPLRFAAARTLAAEDQVIDLEGLQRPRGAPVDAGLKTLWARGQELRSGAPIWLPFELVHADYTDQRPPGSGLFVASTNGLASGNHPLEAVCHGLCEVIERDATADWIALPRSERLRRRLDLESVEDPSCRELLERFAAADMSVAVWDTTSRIGVAAFECMIADARSDIGHSARGAGCHPVRAVALARALSEAAQVRATYVAAARDDLSPAEFETERTLERSQRARALIEEGRGQKDFSEVPSHEAPHLEDDLRHILDCLAAAGFDQVAALDLTRPEFGVAVVRVVVPGLRMEGEGEAGFETAPRPLRRAAPEPARGYVFAGPSLAAEEVAAHAGLVCLPPARQGDILRAARERPLVIGLIDGVFDGSTAPWHKEILWALQQGVHVYGAASMGALRAAELHPFGMQGIGRIFESYRDGRLEDDDEVAVLHGPAEMGHRPLSEAMVSLRESLAKAVSAGVLGAATAERLTAIAKATFYQQRSLERILEAGIAQGLPAAELADLRHWWSEQAVDAKRDDARTLLAAVTALLAAAPPPFLPDFEVERSDMWLAVLAEAGAEEEDPDQALLAPWILDEARLALTDFKALQDSALLRLLSLREAERRGAALASDSKVQAFHLFRQARGLVRLEDAQRWAQQNGLSPEAFDRLIEDEAKRAALDLTSSSGLAKQMLNELRLTGRYADLAARAGRKRNRIRALGYEDPRPEDVVRRDLPEGAALAKETRAPAMLKWYFATRLQTPVPEDLSGYVGALGLAGLDEFYRLVTREYLYSRHSREGGDGGSGAAGEGARDDFLDAEKD